MVSGRNCPSELPPIGGSSMTFAPYARKPAIVIIGSSPPSVTSYDDPLRGPLNDRYDLDAKTSAGVRFETTNPWQLLRAEQPHPPKIGKNLEVRARRPGPRMRASRAV